MLKNKYGCLLILKYCEYNLTLHRYALCVNLYARVKGFWHKKKQIMSIKQ